MDAIDYNLKKVFQFYRSLLDDNNKQQYDKLLMGLIDYQNIIVLKGIDSSFLPQLFDYIRLDHPLLFYVKELNYRYEPHIKLAIVYPKYRFDQKRANDNLNAVLNTVEKFVSPLVNKCEFQKEMAIHDFICDNDTYDLSLADSSFECVGPLLFNKGVCEGISKAVKLLCDFSGMQCIVLRGTTIRTDITDINHNSSSQHVWNKIKIDNAYYNLDVTFDLSLSSQNTLRYDYYNLCDYDVLKDHHFNENNYPGCSKNNCYYLTNHQCFDSLDSIKNYFRSLIASNKRCIVLKVTDDSLRYIDEADIIYCFNDVLKESFRYDQRYLYSYNEYQNVMQIDLL